MSTERQFFDQTDIQKYDYNQYQGLKGESEARFGLKKLDKLLMKQLVETGRSGFDRFPKEHHKNEVCR